MQSTADISLSAWHRLMLAKKEGTADWQIIDLQTHSKDNINDADAAQ
jgi:hypothetical protein